MAAHMVTHMEALAVLTVYRPSSPGCPGRAELEKSKNWCVPRFRFLLCFLVLDLKATLGMLPRNPAAGRLATGTATGTASYMDRKMSVIDPFFEAL
jgi:hypothetical protein